MRACVCITFNLHSHLATLIVFQAFYFTPHFNAQKLNPVAMANSWCKNSACNAIHTHFNICIYIPFKSCKLHDKTSNTYRIKVVEVNRYNLIEVRRQHLVVHSPSFIVRLITFFLFIKQIEKLSHILVRNAFIYTYMY